MSFTDPSPASASASSASIVSTTTSASPSATTSSSSDNLSNPSTFYKNLFYILIGLLCAFGVVSFLSLMRARHRRNQIFREAERLGVIVPGIPGYVPVRDRQGMRWTRSDGRENPDWWDVEKDAWRTQRPQAVQSSLAPKLALSGLVDQDTDFHPLALIPPRPLNQPVEPIEVSPLPFFPNHLAYRPESLVPPPPKFTAADPDSLDGLVDETLDVVAIVRMPGEEWPSDKPVDENEEVVKEWAGIELGIVTLHIGDARARAFGG